MFETRFASADPNADVQEVCEPFVDPSKVYIAAMISAISAKVSFPQSTTNEWCRIWPGHRTFARPGPIIEDLVRPVRNSETLTPSCELQEKMWKTLWMQANHGQFIPSFCQKNYKECGAYPQVKAVKSKYMMPMSGLTFSFSIAVPFFEPQLLVMFYVVFNSACLKAPLATFLIKTSSLISNLLCFLWSQRCILPSPSFVCFMSWCPVGRSQGTSQFVARKKKLLG